MTTKSLLEIPKPSIHARLDSTVALHWTCGNGVYKQFVSNRVAQIRAHPEIQWRHVPTKDNPADIVGRGSPVISLALWWSGPTWLQDVSKWLDNPVTRKSSAAEGEPKIIREVLCVHCETHHGGVGLTMAAVRERYWIPRLRSLAKGIHSKCWGCKRFQIKAVTPPVSGLLPEDRTKPGTAFEVIGVDFAGPIRYKMSSKVKGKAYMVIFACSLTRAVHLELLCNLETTIYIGCLKRFIARRGRPRIIYSDNGGTFVKASKWLEQLHKDKGYVVSWKITK